MRASNFLSLCALSVASLSGITAAQDVVRVGHLSIAADGPLYIAMEKGYFKEANIEIRLESFASAVTAMAPLSSGEIQVVGGGIGPPLFNAYARAFPVRVVGARSRNVPGNSGDTLMVRKDLVAQIRRAADLKGRKVAVNAPGSPLTYLVGKLLESEGLSLKDVDLVNMPWPDMAPAFDKRAIEVGALVEPFSSLYSDKGLGDVWKRASDVLKGPGWEIAVLFYNDDWAKKNPRAANEFMVAYIKASRDMMQAWNRGKNRAEIIDIMVKHTRVKDRALYDKMHWGHVDPNGEILKDSIRDQQEFFAKLGQVPKMVDIDAIIDARYVKYALQKLGVQR